MAIGVLTFSEVALATPVSGTRLNGTISQSIDSKSATVGEPVTLTNVTSTSGTVIRGARMYGTVTNVVRAGQGRPAKLEMRFTRLTLASGATYAVSGLVTGMQANTKNNALKEAAGAVGGMIIGNIVGKSVLHTNLGGLAGAAGGFLIAKNNRQNLTVSRGSTVSVELTAARRQASH
jgi:hypothetical protein